MDKNIYEFSVAVVTLLKGVVNESTQTKIWNTIIENQIQIEDYISKMGLTLMVQTQDGYAYVKQREYKDDEMEIPRLISRRQLKYNTSLLLVLLRKEYAESNKEESIGRSIFSKKQILEKMRTFLKDTNDEAKQKKEIEQEIKRVEELGFIRALKNSEEQFEILPLIRGFVDAQWLENFDEKLEEYANYGLGIK
ncbi:DUF4194 domain-containing protein [Fusobacterium necrophorum]|uniref:DUF4194 domain-containing protein n=2 Tax=Fusobacterium necrophorum TaxID=859 RepID=A0AB73BT98_9FUSO|nr:DUF4194 domain-containing protein [Fusobacterium necrophorum]AYZ74416.1 DUF4194 domain-containing protein [Fusobacterium necrophorum]AZW09698.1 DUF4194 domain-containing protein [Fusobacterium necrophorum subsp. necrophorum]KDE60866.1 hypothetical protein FUSO3_11695 [Fusobacterium necrophorum BL]KDE64496.1 hypothetical protein FUSO4_07910 [Fusobacterium necrophorum DJ-1]KDE68986.1 hypothetical protein FUSO8_12560 [Fusobacterium necrophorum DJ-2]